MSVTDDPGVYDLREADGSWWVVGWDPELGTFFAQHLSREVGREAVVLADFGRLAGEITSVERLAEQVGRRLPEALTVRLTTDAAALPAREVVARLPWDLRHASQLTAAGVAEREVGWSTALARIAQLYRDNGVSRLESLPAHPVAETFHALYEAAGSPRSGVERFVQRLGVDPPLAVGILSGDVADLGGGQIGQVCEALRCSPYDLWGVELAQGALHLYPPDRWPGRIQPLDSLCTPPATASQAQLRLREFVEEQALERLREHEPPASWEAADSTVVTAYRRTGVLERFPGGQVRQLGDGAVPANASADYHLVFEAVGEPLHAGTLGEVGANDGPPSSGWNVEPIMARLAEASRVVAARTLEAHDSGVAEVELVRFTPLSGPEVWFRWEEDSSSWERVRDPRSVYPGSPSDVVGHLGVADPRPFDRVEEVPDGLPGVGAGELSELGGLDAGL